MSDIWILTDHGVEQVEAVVQYAEDGSNVEAVNEFVAATRPFAPAYRARPIGAASQIGEMPVELGQWVVRRKSGAVTVHDTDPCIELTWEWRVHMHGDPTDWLDRPDEQSARDELAPEHGDTLAHRPTFTFTINGEPWTLVGDWEEVDGE